MSSKRIIDEYGIGTCGPPTFFGTLDLHLSLQEKISEVLSTEDSLLYSNSYACIHSVISCFSSKSDVIFYQKCANEAIIRGITLSKSKCHEFYSIDSLSNIFKLHINSKVNNFLIIEGLSKNEGTIVDLPRIIQMKKMFNFKIILDESLSIPLLHKTGVCGFFDVDPKHIEIRIGSFSYGFASNGGFFTGKKDFANYQRLGSSSYVFSASLPGVLANFNKMAFDLDFDHLKLRRKVKKFHSLFVSTKFLIVSSVESPIILIRTKDIIEKKAMLLNLHKIVEDLHRKNIYVGININNVPTLRVIVNVNQKKIKSIVSTILESCENVC